MLLTFSFSQLVTESLGVITSIINFILGNELLLILLGISIVLSLVFAVYSRLKR